MKKILVPTDFSKQAGYALDAAVDLAKRTDAEIVLLHVVEGFVPGSFSTMGGVPDDLDQEVFMKKLIEKSKRDLHKLADKDENSDVKITPTVQVGNAFTHISKDILENQADLVIMGSQGTSGYEEVFIGSNTEKIVRHADCPVITVKNPVDFDQVNEIAFAADFRDGDNNVIKPLKDLQNVLGAKLHLVKVDTPGTFESSRTIKKRIKAFVQQHGLENYTMEIYNEYTEEDGIIYFAEDIDADLIALSTHGRTGLIHLLSGSIAEDVVNHAQRPVWTCKVDD
ncbi:MAG: universal stress protein [Cyclobacteriaceae bacterium]|nr:universal stress protein [Cyclobacteriaceae bacterium]